MKKFRLIGIVACCAVTGSAFAFPNVTGSHQPQSMSERAAPLDLEPAMPPRAAPLDLEPAMPPRAAPLDLEPAMPPRAAPLR